MIESLNVHMVPSLTSRDALADRTAVVIDVLRASTTIAYGLAAGAKEIVPCLEVSEARDVADRRGRNALLGGERGGLKIDGFDLGNSPGDYTAESVNARTIVMTTTNGTRAISVCSLAKEVLIGAFVNLSSVVAMIENAANVDLLCAGTGGQVTREDVLLAGAFVDRILRRSRAPGMNDQALLARDAWRHVLNDTGDLEEVLQQTQGGKNLLGIGLAADIAVACGIDDLAVVPRLNRCSGSLQLTI